MVNVNRFSFGSTAAIVAGMALVAGLDAAALPKPAIVSSLLIVAIADNLTDSLSIHVYQESERLEPARAFLATLTNFGARLAVSLSFVLIVALMPLRSAVVASVVWGLLLLAALSWMIARQRRVRALPEVVKHLLVAVAVIFLSKLLGEWIPAQFA